ncbi:MAG: phosphatase PAP2 family protein [Rubrivivax sp.]|nr:MAG: phosphatase PAP2 family protein [Rubrivivax sp.]
MLSFAQGAPQGEHRRFLMWHGVAWPVALAALAIWLRHSGWDDRISALFFDVQSQHFMAGREGWAEWLGHRVAKSVVLTAWLLVLAAALAAGLPAWPAAWSRYRPVLWATALAMGLGPAVVAGLKDINSHACPWSLTGFGGTATYSAHWFVPLADAGRCFPGGHAAGGFSLIAVMFAGRALQWRALERRGLWLALGVGSLFSLVRLAQGAHFMSHNLWSAAIDWWVAALVFSPLLLRRSPLGTSDLDRPGQALHGGAQ